MVLSLIRHLKWEKAEIILNLKKISLDFEFKKNQKIKINKSNLKWILKMLKFTDVFEIRRFCICKKNKNIWNIKQYPKVNGGIVALNPFTGEVKGFCRRV